MGTPGWIVLAAAAGGTGMTNPPTVMNEGRADAPYQLGDEVVPVPG